MNADYDHLFKVMMFGDSGCGKTALVHRFMDDSFNAQPKATVGVDFTIKTLNIDQKIIKLQVWDTAGQERFRTLTPAYYRGAYGIVYVYDITREKTFENVEYWRNEVHQYSNMDIVELLLGNKCDEWGQRQITQDSAMAYADKHGLEFMEVSAKESINVNTAFMKLATRVTEKNKGVESVRQGTQDDSVQLNNESTTRTGCCSR